MDSPLPSGYTVAMRWHHEKGSADNSLRQQVVGTFQIAIPLVIVVFALLMSLYLIEMKSRKKQLTGELARQEKAYLDITALTVGKNIANMGRDLLTLKDFTASSIARDDMYSLEQQYLSMANHYRIYDQIRYIDAAGNEKVRINYTDGKAEVVPPSLLQNKKERYYFQNSCHLRPDDIYISPLDLNVEDGKLELPYKPMIRLATPVVDASGMPGGIVVLNYLAANVLEVIESVYRGYEANLSLVNKEGYFLIHDEDRTKEFGFMVDGGGRYTLAELNAEIYQRSEASAQGWYATDRGLFSFNRLYPFEHAVSSSEEDTEYTSPIMARSWLLITHIQQSTIDAQLAHMQVLSPLLLVVLSAGIFSLLVMLSYLLHHKRYERELVQFLAHFDQLTGCYNRGWGLKLLQETLAKARKKEQMLAFLFIDLDRFKQVNDTYGHKAGDVVLQESAKRIQGSLRLDDTVVRLGGDEFLAVIPFTSEENVLPEIPERIYSALQEPISHDGVTIHIGSSIGVALYPRDGSRVKDLVAASDKAMYQAKTNKDLLFVLYRQGM